MPQGNGRWQLRGQLDMDNVGRLLQASRPLLFADGAAELELDLAAVEHTDSAGLALLVEWLRAARHNDRRIRFRGMPAQMRAMAEVSGLDRILPLVD